MGPRRFGLVLAVTASLALLPHLPAGAAEEYFISPDGNDGASGSASAPWATFEHALPRLDPGDVLTVRGGTYLEEVRNPKLSSATSGDPITVRAYPGERPVIEGLLWLKDMDYWRFDGINVTWGNGASDEHMVKLTDGTGWQYVNSEIWGAQSFAGVLVASSGGSEPHHWQVAGNCIHDTGSNNSKNQDHLIYANSGHSGSGLIEGNVMFNAPNGEGVKLGGSSPDSGGSANVTVRHNTIVNTAQSILIGWSSSDNVVEGNLLAGVSDNYANIRGYELTGKGNRAAGNLGTGSVGLILNDAGWQAIADGGGNVHGIDPGFDSAGCNGFRPTNPDAQGFGHTAVGSSVSTASTGTFTDDDPSIFEGDIDRLAAAGITSGCNPPANDRFCPDAAVTRGQMAAFLVRALGLGGGGGDRFADDDLSIFEGDIDRLAAAGITSGCNPPANGRFCPDRPVRRGEMATFLARAAGLSGDWDGFGDVAGSVHAADIGAIASAGITRGCNPPDNDRYCPHRAVTRAEMAAFLVRAFDP